MLLRVTISVFYLPFLPRSLGLAVKVATWQTRSWGTVHSKIVWLWVQVITGKLGQVKVMTRSHYCTHMPSLGWGKSLYRKHALFFFTSTVIWNERITLEREKERVGRWNEIGERMQADDLENGNSGGIPVKSGAHINIHFSLHWVCTYSVKTTGLAWLWECHCWCAASITQAHRVHWFMHWLYAWHTNTF